MLNRKLGFKNKKPPLWATLDFKNDYARKMQDCFLFNEGAGGDYRNLCSRKNGIPKGSLPNWDRLDKTVALKSTSIQAMQYTNPINYVSGDFAIRTIFKFNNWNSTYACLFAKKNGAARELGVFYNSSGAISYIEVGGSAGFATVGNALSLNTRYDIILTRIGSTLKYYVNGVLNTSTTQWNGMSETATSGNTTNPMGLGWDDSSYPNNYGIVSFYAFQTWVGRGLTAGDAKYLYNNPYCFIKSGSRRMPLITSAGGAAPATTLFRRSSKRAGSRTYFNS